jgi:hypothetical protein
MKLTLGLIFLSVLVAVNSVTEAKPKNNDVPVYIPTARSGQVIIVEEGGLCDNYYLICNPDVKGKKYLACVYDHRLKGSYCKKFDYYDPKKNTQPNYDPKKDTNPTDPRPKTDGATKGSGNNANGMAAIANAVQNNPIGSLPGAAKANKKA